MFESPPRYLPILKSRQGELRALRELDDRGTPVDPLLTPIIELVEADFSELSLGDRRSLIDRLVTKVATAWPPGRPRVIIDTARVELDPTDEQNDGHDLVPPEFVTPQILRRLAEQHVRAVPVIRLSDDSRFLEEVRASLSSADEPGACLRIGGDDLDDQIVPIERAAEHVLAAVGLTAETVDLVLDFGALGDDDHLTLATRVGRFVLPSLDRMPWRSFSTSAGAFPVNLGAVAAYTIADLPRRDRSLWVQLNRLQLRRPIDFSDYAVTHPALQTGVAFAAPPQLRYTSDRSWIVMKGRRTDRRGHKQFYDLCGRLLTERSADVSASFDSWGDEQIHLLAGYAGFEEAAHGPGNASTWRAIATSHHIGYVRHQLNRRGEP